MFKVICFLLLALSVGAVPKGSLIPAEGATVLVTLTRGNDVERMVERAESKLYKADSITAISYDLLANICNSNVVDFSCVSTVGADRKVATLIAPDTAITCAHFHSNVGDTLLFGTNEAKVVSVSIPSYLEEKRWDNDYCILMLDHAVPVKHAVFAPVDWDQYFDPEGTEVTCVYTSVKTSRLGWGNYLVDRQLFGFSGSGSPVGYRHGDQFVVVGLLISAGGQTAQPRVEFEGIKRGWL